MTVSTDWLERLAKALDVRLVDLLDDNSQKSIERLGATGRGDRIEPISESEQFNLDVPADDPVAIEISNATGNYQKGMTVIGSRYTDANIVNAVGRDAIICLPDGSLLLRKLVQLPSQGGYALVPLESKEEILFVADIKWAAPVIMTVSYK